MARNWTPATDEEFERQYEDALERAATDGRPRAASVRYDRATGMVELRLREGGTFSFAAAECEGLAGADPASLEDVRLIGEGDGLRWDALDVDLGIPALLQGRFGSERWMARRGAGWAAEMPDDPPVRRRRAN